MDVQAVIDALRRVRLGYMENVGNPARQLVGGGVRGLLGFDPPEYADSLGMEAYRNAAALGNAPTPLAFAALPAAVVKASGAAKIVASATARPEMLVYHGTRSPSLDGATFDLSRVGSGAGAQTEGWGGYFATSKANASRFGPYVYSAKIPDDVVDKLVRYNQSLAEQPDAVRVALLDRATPSQALVANRYNQKLREAAKNHFLRDPVLEQAGYPPQDAGEFAKWLQSLPAHQQSKLGVQDPTKTSAYTLMQNMADIYGPRAFARMLEGEGIPGGIYSGLDWRSSPKSTNLVIWDQDVLSRMPLTAYDVSKSPAIVRALRNKAE